MTTQSTERQAVVDAFQHLYYDQPENTWDNTYWLGVPTQKCPLDLWVYQEIIFELRPDVIVECGTCKGGSALFLASMCDMVRNGRVFSIDIEPQRSRPNHKRVRYILGSSTDPDVAGLVRQQTRPKDRVLVFLDSDHTKEHVLNELRAYPSGNNVQVTQPVFLRAMMNRELSTAAPINAIGVYGLVSFLYGGERLDLYTFCAVSLALLCLLWPRRLEWEAMFKEFSAKYPGVPSNP